MARGQAGGVIAAISAAAIAAPVVPAAAADAAAGAGAAGHTAQAIAAQADKRSRVGIKLRGPKEVSTGSDVALRGKLRGSKGKQVRVKIELLDSNKWSRVHSLRTNSRGKFRVGLTVAATGSVSFRAAAKTQRRKPPVVSKTVTVAITPAADLSDAPGPKPSPTKNQDPAKDTDPTSGSAMTEQEQQMVMLVNQARAAGQTCGEYGYFPPAAPLAADNNLADAAQAHSDDMVAKNFFSHVGSNGSQPWDRMDKQGYQWSRAGENIAAGYSDAAAATAGLVKSPGHCKNIMNPDFTEIGVGVATGDADFGIYWTQNFGAPRNW